MDKTTFVPLPLLCAAETSVLRVEVEPSSHEMPEEEFGVAKADHRISQLRPFIPDARVIILEKFEFQRLCHRARPARMSQCAFCA